MNPLDIFQAALDAVSKRVTAGDFAAYAALLDFPYLVQTSRATMLVTNPDEMRPTFEALVDGLRARGITHHERVAGRADYVARDRIEGWHQSHLIIDGERVAEPHLSRHVIVRRDGRWLFSEAQYDRIDAAVWPLDDKALFGHLREGAEALT